MYGLITGTGSYIPKTVITNRDLEENLDTTDEWIRERTGIEKRHIMSDGTVEMMATVAGKQAMSDAKINAEDIQLIIVSSVSSECVLPSTACAVQKNLKAKNAMCFDLNAACTGFLTAYNMAQSYINAGMIDNALIIGAEKLSNLVDWKDRSTAILFGDGAGAAVIQKSERAVFHSVMHADGEKGNALLLSQSFSEQRELSSYIQMDGQEVFRFAVKQVPLAIKELLGKMGKEEEQIKFFLLHQANLRIIQLIARKIGTTMEKVPVNLMNYGNTSSASIPILLDEMKKNGKLMPGDEVVMSGFGAGLTWGATYLVF